MQLLAEINSGEVLASGIYPALTGDAGILWRDGYNVVFDNESVRKAKGLLGLENLLARPTGMQSTVAASEPRLFVGAGSKAYRYRSSDGLTEIGSFAASAGIFQFVPWDTWALISNGVDPLELWKNTGSSAPISAPFTRANVIFPYITQVFAGGTDNGGAYVEWCHINNIELWTPTQSNAAGALRLRELSGDIVCARPIGGAIGIYGRSNAGIFGYVGGTAPFSFRKPISGVGAISPYSVVSVADRHYGLTQENAFITDLVSFQLIDEPAMREYVAELADWDRIQEVYGWQDWANSMVRWAVPQQGGGVFGIGYRYDRNVWTRFDDNVIMGEQSGPFANMFLAKTNRLLRQIKSSPNNDGSALASMVRTIPMAFGDRNKFKKLAKIAINGSWTGTVNLKIGYSNTPDETPDWALTTPLVSEIYPDQFGIKNEAPYITLQIESTALNADWRISGAAIWGEVTANVT